MVKLESEVKEAEKIRRAAHEKKLAKLNREDKSGNHRPRRPVKTKFVSADDLNLDFWMF